MSSIPLAIQTPQAQSPLSSIGELLKTKDLASQIALRQAQTQSQQADAAQRQVEAQKIQRQQRDIQTVQDSLADPAHPEYATAWGKGDLSFLNGKVDPTTQLALQTQHTKLLQDQASADTTTIKNKQEAWGAAGQTLAGLQHLYEQAEAKAPGSGAATVAAAYPDAVAQLKQLPGMQGVNIPSSIDGTPQTLAQLSAHTNSTKAFYDTVAAQKQEAATTAKTSAEAQGLQQKADMQKQWAQQFQANPQAGSTIIDKIMGNDPAAASYKAALAAAPDVATGQELIKAAAAHAAARQEKLDPAIANQEVNIAGRKAFAEIPAAVAKAQAVQPLEIAKSAAIGSAAAGRTDAIKLDQEYAKKKEAVESLGTVLNMAEAGNKTAGGNVPLVTVGMLNAINGIKRMNGAEISQNSHLGSLYDDVAGRLGKLTVGQPIPKDILNDTRQLFQAVGQEPYQTYVSNLKALGTRTGQEIKPTQGPPNVNASSSPLAVTAPNGKTYHFNSQADADAFRKEAGIP